MSILERLAIMKALLCLPLVVFALGIVANASTAQDAKPEDQNAVNAKKIPSNMMEDSPVTFPERGALPAKYGQDVKTKPYPAEKDYFLFSSPSRSPVEMIRRANSVFPMGRFVASCW